MSFTSVELIVFVLAVAFVAQFVSGAWRLALFLAASAVFFVTYVPNPIAALPILVFVGVGYCATMLVGREHYRTGLGLVVAVLVAAFVWLKRYPFVEAIPPLPFPYVLVGLSYILFRMLHVIFEVRNGTFPVPSFPRYIAYLFFFPSFLSGPINLYPPFARDLDSPAEMDSEAAFQTLARFLKGFAKVTIVSELLLLPQAAVVARLDGAEGPMLAGLYAIAAGVYLLYLYANFSGYTDMAITIARLFGVILPENFRHPFQAINFQDFWSRWHITLSEWFKIYFFNPLLLGLMRRFPDAKLAPYLSVLTLFVVFLVLGAWHGASWEYMLVGFLLATGMAVNKLWQIELTKRIGKSAYRALTARSSYALASRGLTLAWISVALTTFWVDVAGASELASRLGPLWSVVSLALMSAAFAAGVLASQMVLDRGSAWISRRGPPRASVRYAFLGLAVALLAFAVPAIDSSGNFVYQAF